MEREQQIEIYANDEIADWRADIQRILTSIDTASGLTIDDKKLLKRFVFEECLPPSIQDVVRKYFPDDFTYDVLRGISEAMAGRTATPRARSKA